MTRWLPTTRAGRWAAWFLAAFVLLVGLNVIVLQPLSSGDRFRLEYAVVWTAGAASLTSAVAAAAAILRDKERAIVVFVAILPALLVAVLNLAPLFD